MLNMLPPKLKWWEIFISIIWLLIFPTILWGWLDRDGTPLPDEPDRKSIGEFGAWLVLTDKESKAFENWRTPSDSVFLRSTRKLETGKVLTALIIFGGCAVDKKGNCNVFVKFKITDPKGAIYADLPYQEVWADKPVPPNKSLGMSIGYIRIVIEDDEPLGKYTVEAIVIDRNKHEILELLAPFQAVKS